MTKCIKNALSIFILGYCLALGAGAIGCQNVETDYEEGVAALKAEDYETALKKFRSAAEAGHPGAQAAMGELYFQGKGTPRNAQEAAKWYRQAADQGNVDAQVTLGWMYNVGTGVPQDFNEALKWFRLAAEQGHPGAQNNLGVLYRQGRGGQKDEEQAVAWFLKAANQEVATAQYALGQMYLKGEGVKQNIEKAVGWYARAADQGLLEAQADLGFLYAKRENKVPEDFLIAYKWLTLAIQQGDRMAPSDLEELKTHMTPEQIAEAEQLVKAWNQKHQKNMES
jgi:TPR repeat protein